MSSGMIAQLMSVSKRYQTRWEIVNAIEEASLDVRQDDYIAIMGPSGSGKTTLLNLLGGIDRPSGGEVRLEGERIDTLAERALLNIRRHKIGFVFQEARLLPSLTALENVLLPTAFWNARTGDESDRALELLDKVGIRRRAHHLVHELSGGEAQRVCIARALLTNPRMVLADEPTGNLDHSARTDIIALIEHLLVTSGSAIVIVTHDSEIAARAKRRFVMHEGRLIDAMWIN
jgi:putative ABC transport system ATP-binding protein